MPPVPTLPGVQVVKALERAGFDLVRVTGSHHRMSHPDGRHVTVPVHRGRDMPRGTLRAIIRDAGMTVEQFLSLVE
ncbi:addiction module toxin, HicA family protein [Actinomadura sp. NBRC 104425]|uniref:type II toxin-antitoxin system HicA family toxin n=1 Tax=Actinomadura sp. NBRC 104425 TaxID=3032204 RepID=UPI0024A4DC6B|nr:type II toxin-antitoxin system HicA family toxin [Actinomadura sp. NBRC 104425]GLZ14696.1 addiction module toxin, HicA family protein [Actinomadura sp. NBRC 104425]